MSLQQAAGPGWSAACAPTTTRDDSGIPRSSCSPSGTSHRASSFPTLAFSRRPRSVLLLTQAHRQLAHRRRLTVLRRHRLRGLCKEQPRFTHRHHRLLRSRSFVVPSLSCTRLCSHVRSLSVSSHLFPGQYGPTEHPNLTISDLALIPSSTGQLAFAFVLRSGLLTEGSPRSWTVPYAIVVAAERRPGQLVVAANSTLWEFSYDSFGQRLGSLSSVHRLTDSLACRHLGLRRRRRRRRVDPQRRLHAGQIPGHVARQWRT